MVNMGNHPKIALFQVSELLSFAQTSPSSFAAFVFRQECSVGGLVARLEVTGRLVATEAMDDFEQRRNWRSDFKGMIVCDCLGYIWIEHLQRWNTW